MKRVLFLIISIFGHLRFDNLTSKSHTFFSQKNIVLFLLFIVLMLSSCFRDRVVDTRKLSVVNESETDIYWVRSESGTLKKTISNDDVDLVKVNSIGLVGNIVPPWDVTIANSKNKKLTIYIVIKDSVDKYGWANVYKKNKFSKKYLIDMQYLKDNKWTIVYP